MAGSENFALPQLNSMRVPSTWTSTGLAGSARVISDSSRPDTKTVPPEAISAGTWTSAETSKSNPAMVSPVSDPVIRTPARTGFDGGLLGRLRATQATASAKSSRTSRNFKSEPTVVVATSIASLHHPSRIPAGSGGQITHRRALTAIFKANQQV